MIINKIGICNFGSFEGELELDISINDAEKNVVLIGGKNGAGKTTLFTAIKLGLYGPVAFGYDNTSSSYYRRIKRLINKHSLRKKDVNTYVLLDFQMEEDRELANYVLIRQWKYDDQDLIESFKVQRNNQMLSEEETESFESYLKVLIPPQLFDLFFFDGEKISDFFLAGNTSKNLRDALLLLCGYDTFDIMNSNFRRVLHKGNEDLLDEEEKCYAELQREADIRESSIKFEKMKLEDIDTNIKDFDEKQQQLEKKFRKEGGLLAEEILKINNNIVREEKLREEKNEWFKEFANDTLPFIIVSDLVQQVKQQISRENMYQKYKTIKEALNDEFLKQVIREEINNTKVRIIDENNNNYGDDFSIILAKHIDEKIKPNFDSETFQTMHFLSHDEENDIQVLIRHVEGQRLDEIKRYKEDIAQSIQMTQKLRKKLEASEKNNEILSSYASEIEELKEQHGKLLLEKGRTEAYIENLVTQKAELDILIKKADEKLKKLRKDKSILLLCKNAQDMLSHFIPTLIERKLEIVKSNFMYMFKQLISKQDYIQDIDIDKNFNVTLYQQSSLQVTSIKNMISKIGLEAFANHMGELCVEELKSKLGISRKSEIEKSLMQHNEDVVFELPVKIDINGFSKGEQQIYIMSLYWALIKMSDNKIPFVIDTPYARIDSMHRERITTRFFPNLSSQVLILSTDEEINNEYYSLIMPYISKEFLISYSDVNHCTSIEKRYFFEVAS